MNVLYAILAATVLTAAMVALGFLARRWRNLLEAVRRKAATSPASFGYIAGRARMISVIHDLGGQTTVTRELLGLKPNEGFQISSLSSELSGSGTVKDNPTLVTQPRNMSAFESGGKGTHTGTFKLTFEPPLKPADPPVAFAVAATFDGLHKMTRAEVKRAYQKDLFRNESSSLEVTVPVDHVELSVQFPAGFEADVFPAAFYAKTEVIAYEELARVRKGFKYEGGKAELAVEKPVLTYVYAIGWMPRR